MVTTRLSSGIIFLISAMFIVVFPLVLYLFHALIMKWCTTSDETYSTAISDACFCFSCISCPVKEQPAAEEVQKQQQKETKSAAVYQIKSPPPLAESAIKRRDTGELSHSDNEAHNKSDLENNLRRSQTGINTANDVKTAEIIASKNSMNKGVTLEHS